MKTSVLLIDDEEQIRKLLGRIISLEGYEITEASSLSAARKILKHSTADIILCDVKLPDGTGIDFVKEVLANHPGTEIILLTAFGLISDGINAMKNGAFDYLVKGDDNDRILPLLSKAAEKSLLAKRVRQLESKVGKKYAFDSMIGSAPSFQNAVTLAKKVAATDSAVLVLGETGTGKEVFAQAIHQADLRKSKNFVALNCSAFSRELLENELFGHKAGAFTGAMADQKGLFDEASDGTLFLDEIGELPIDLQAKLLRVLETKEYLRVGDSKPMKADVRIIAATNRDLQKEIEHGNFREDLYYRLAVFPITLPALRERVKDIPELAKSFAEQFAHKTNKATPEIPQEFINALTGYNWPGNIRQLKNIIERSVILLEGKSLSTDTLPNEFRAGANQNLPSALSLSAAERKHIISMLQHTNGNKTETARILEIGLTTLYRKIEEYQLTEFSK